MGSIGPNINVTHIGDFFTENKAVLFGAPRNNWAAGMVQSIGVV